MRGLGSCHGLLCIGCCDPTFLYYSCDSVQVEVACGGAWGSLGELGGAWGSLGELGGAWGSLGELGGAWGSLEGL